MKKTLCLIVACMLMLACVPAMAEGETEIEVLCGLTLDTFASQITGIIDSFTAETGTKVIFSSPGNGYEELMKTRMASNDLPDVFCTHGWAVARYGEYLLPLNDQPFADKIVDAIRPIVTDNDGNLLVLPSSYVSFGINYNADVLAEAGVDPESIKTWTDFEAALDKVKSIGKAGLAMGGKDSWTSAQVFQVMCPTFFSAEETAQLADGSYDWNKLAPVIERYSKWVDNGWFNVDCVTADFITATQYLGDGSAAFLLCDTSAIAQAKSTSPDANLHVIPFPAWEADYSAQMAGTGEHLSWGVWKDSQKRDAALSLLEYFAKPEVAKILAESTSCPAGLSDCEFDLGALTGDFINLGKYVSVPVWDRTLPSGMFNDMCTVGQSILAQEDDDVDSLVEVFRSSYEEKMY